MAVPDYQSLMLPVLRSAEQVEVRIGNVVERLADQLGLASEDRAAVLPSGRQTIFSNRVHWAKTYLAKAGLLELTRRGHFRITERGRQVLAENPKRIDNDLLKSFEEFREFLRKSAEGRHDDAADAPVKVPLQDERTPDEIMRDAHSAVEKALRQDLLERIYAAPPEFFERLVVKLLIEMGYGGTIEGAGRALGRVGDDGVDGVIDQDALGLDRVYIQAKRYALAHKVSAGAIRDFSGSLDLHRASKGLFVTTSDFTDDARVTAEKLRSHIVLINGDQLAALMVRYNVGVRVEETLHLKKIDEDFFLD
jgi:restriction system protein